MPIRWICSGSWGGMTPLTIISEKPLPARFGNTGRYYNHMSGRIIKWDGAMRAYSLLLRFTGTGGRREEATPYGGSHCVAGALQARATVRGEPLLAHSGRRKAEQCISDGYLVPIVAVDSKVPFISFIGATAAGWWSSSTNLPVSRKNCIISGKWLPRTYGVWPKWSRRKPGWRRLSSEGWTSVSFRR